MIKIAIVAGEISGDNLGAELIKSIKQQYPDAKFFGIGGRQMIAAGMESYYPMERLSVMGIIEVLGRLFELLKIRKELCKKITKQNPDLFIGIDAPDFNLGLELKLKEQGIKTAHYVSPSVWAWRSGRIKKIKKAVDKMLLLFPFEKDIYDKNAIAAECVGHPLAEIIDYPQPPVFYQRQLGLNAGGGVIAVLPGSRISEVKWLLPDFLSACKILLDNEKELRFVIPAVTKAVGEVIKEILQQNDAALTERVTITEGAARDVMAAADQVLVASGTATLEAMLVGRPMVMAYKMAPLSYFIISRLVKINRFALPNLLAGEELVEEYIQKRATPENLAGALLELYRNADKRAKIEERFAAIKELMRSGSGDRAAQAVLDLIEVNDGCR